MPKEQANFIVFMPAATKATASKAKASGIQPKQSYVFFLKSFL